MPAVMENSFLMCPEDAYAIYQLKNIPENRDRLFARLAELDHPVQKDHYEMIYTGPLPDGKDVDNHTILEDLFIRFNLCQPDDFRGHSLSVSDVIALKRGDKIQSYYTDSYRFQELPDFFPADSPLKNAEMLLEDDLNMLDGLINNGKKQEPEITGVIVSAADDHKHRPHRQREPER